MQNNTERVLAVLRDSGQRLHALLLRLTLRADVAEDLLQELFLRLHRSAGFAGAANRTAYAFRAAVHLAFEWRRGWKPAAVGLEQIEDVAENAVPPLQTMAAREQMEKVLEMVGTLKGLQRDAVVMRYIQQQSFPSIAEQLNKTPHQVRALCHKGIRRLRNRLAADRKLHDMQEQPRGRN
ncbi:MAG: RNA polymerase sigma factor [Deltaproteobacteria bacterium]